MLIETNFRLQLICNDTFYQPDLQMQLAYAKLCMATNALTTVVNLVLSL